MVTRRINNMIDDTISVRLVTLDDIELYFKYGFEESSDETKHFTGTTQDYTIEQIRDYIVKVVNDNTRRDYLIFDSGRMVGEIVLSDITQNNCHFRICIFNKTDFSRGIGGKAAKWVISTAFNDIGVKNVELEVFPFNKRGLTLYKKIGFKITEQIIDEAAEAPYRDIIVMNLKIDDFKP